MISLKNMCAVLRLETHWWRV